MAKSYGASGRRRASAPASRTSDFLLVVLGVLRNEVVPLFRCLVEREDGFNRAGWHTGAAVDAFVRVNIQHFRGLKLWFVLARMDAVDWADVNARRILGTHARFTDDV